MLYKRTVQKLLPKDIIIEIDEDGDLVVDIPLKYGIKNIPIFEEYYDLQKWYYQYE